MGTNHVPFAEPSAGNLKRLFRLMDALSLWYFPLRDATLLWGSGVLWEAVNYTLNVLSLCIQEPFVKTGIACYEQRRLLDVPDDKLSTVALELMETNQKLSGACERFVKVLEEPSSISSQTVDSSLQHRVMWGVALFSLQKLLAHLRELAARKVAVAHTLLLHVTRMIQALEGCLADGMPRWRDKVEDDEPREAGVQMSQTARCVYEAADGLLQDMQGDAPAAAQDEGAYIGRLALDG